LLTKRQANRQTNNNENISSLAEVKINNAMVTAQTVYYVYGSINDSVTYNVARYCFRQNLSSSS